MGTWDIPSAGHLPPQWGYDPLIAAEVRDRIRHLARTGHGTHEIARRLGVASRTVTRTLRGHR